VCPTCGSASLGKLSPEALARLQHRATTVPTASAKLILRRDEILSRALTDANVAQAGDAAVANLGTDDTILGKYKIVRRLSQGGMAEVFVAKQVGIGGFEKPVALKRIQRKQLDSRHQAIELFLNEAKIAGRLTHPNIVQVLDVGEVDGALYLAMEYVHGRDLRTVTRRLQQTSLRMPLGDACFVVKEVAQALHHAYWSADLDGTRLSVVHRDVSPHNIMIGYDGTVKLLDFGVAMSAVTEHAETMIVGKWLYMSPETTLNEHIDHRSDLFSLGVVLYLLCSGAMPFSGSNAKEIVRKLRAGEYKPLHLVADVPPRLAALVARMLASNPEDRPQTGQEVVFELTEIVRSLNIERTSVNLAALLATLFPRHGGAAIADTDLYSIKELVLSIDDALGGATTKEKSIISNTPSESNQSAVDVSDKFASSSASHHWPPGGPLSRSLSLPAPPHTVAVPPPAPIPPTPVATAPVRASKLRLALRVFMFLSISLLAAVTSYLIVSGS
jgi:serine/threonine protein kinase